MQARPFADREHYGRFLTMQFLFHRELDALFFYRNLEALHPDLGGRRRIELIALDFADIGLTLPSPTAAPLFQKAGDIDLATALGWLYVVEGSNLGAAFLLKYAAQLGFNENFGARHLAGAPEGRGLHWRTFMAALDDIDLMDEQETKRLLKPKPRFGIFMQPRARHFHKHQLNPANVPRWAMPMPPRHRQPVPERRHRRGFPRVMSGLSRDIRHSGRDRHCRRRA